jgi:hypothetical protein
MQTITQASLDPKVDDTRNLQAEQEFCGTMGCSIEIPRTVEEKQVTSLQSSN